MVTNRLCGSSGPVVRREDLLFQPTLKVVLRQDIVAGGEAVVVKNPMRAAGSCGGMGRDVIGNPFKNADRLMCCNDGAATPTHNGRRGVGPDDCESAGLLNIQRENRAFVLE